MVNTRVKNPLLRQANRRLGRQKRAMMRQNLRTLRDPTDSDATIRVEVHKLKIAEQKKARRAITITSPRQTGES